jgi:hypothetical protein
VHLAEDGRVLPAPLLLARATAHELQLSVSALSFIQRSKISDRAHTLSGKERSSKPAAPWRTDWALVAVNAIASLIVFGRLLGMSFDALFQPPAAIHQECESAFDRSSDSGLRTVRSRW